MYLYDKVKVKRPAFSIINTKFSTFAVKILKNINQIKIFMENTSDSHKEAQPLAVFKVCINVY